MSRSPAASPALLSPSTSPVVSPLPNRLISIDVFRGWIMFMMIAHVLGFCEVAESIPESQFWSWLCYHWSHVEWRGMALHDLIQPGFSFLVGTALAFSLASRRRRGQSDRGLVAHAAWRSLVLVLLGVFLRSMSRDQTNWTFEDTLSQIGLGYLPLVLISLAPRAVTWISIGVILIGYWLAFAIYPLPTSDFNYAAVGVDAGWPHLQEGFAAHWNKNSNLAWRFDTWFLNLFPVQTPFTHNRGGYSTLSFIPTLATMLLGLVAGHWLREQPPMSVTVRRFAIAAISCLAIGYALDASGICPNVKRIWTPSWTLFSGGWCFAILGSLHLICDRRSEHLLCRIITFPFIIFGMNSIVAYVMEWIMPGFIKQSMSLHFGNDWSQSIVGTIYAPLLNGAVILLVIWSILFWMHKRQIYVKI